MRISRRRSSLGVLGLGLAAALAHASPQAEPVGVAPPSRDADAAALLGLKTCRTVTVSSSISPAGVLGSSETATVALELTPGTRTTFTLEPYSVRSPDFRLIITDDQGDHELPAPPPTTYRGASAGGDEIWASIYDGGVTAVVVPAAAPLERLYIQPSGLDGPDAPHAVYAASDVLPTGHACGVDGCAGCKAAPPIPSAPFNDRGLGGPCRFFRVAVDCDFPLFQQNGLDAAATIRSVESVMLGVNQTYTANALAAEPRFTISHLAVRTTNASDPYGTFPLRGGDAGQILSRMATVWQPVPIAQRSFVHLFTGRDTTFSPQPGSTFDVVGLANVGGMCNGAVGLSETNFSFNLASRISLTEHEIGHNFGMSHDAFNSPFIMAPSIANPPNTLFSSASTDAFSTLLASRPTCGVTDLGATQPDSASTVKDRPIRIDVLANDGRTGLACPLSVTSFALPSPSTALGGVVSVSVGTGPGGRNEVLYTPPANVQGAVDSFNYTASASTVPVQVDIQTPRAPEGSFGENPGLAAVYYNTWPNGNSNSWWNWETPPSDFSPYATFGSPQTLPRLNYTTLLPGGFARGLSAVITGYISIPTSGYWTFSLAAGSSARATIGDLILTAPSSAAAAEISATRALAPGLHAVRIDYHWGPNPGPRLILSYASSAQPKVVVPASAYFRALGSPPPPCPADFNGSGGGTGGVTVDDIFAFLGAWFANDPRANFDGVGGVTVNDIFAFLGAWFAGCP